jgi:hypothetical protein
MLFSQIIRVRAASLLVAGLVITAPLSALAQADAGSRALAVQLFDEAEALFGTGQLSEACPKYAESYRLDPQLGVLIYLAECYEKNGQLASAWGSFREAEDIARKRGDERAEHARQRAAALEPRLNYVVINVPENIRVPGLQVLRDGAPVAQVVWGARAAIDPGTHRVEAQAPGRKPWQKDVVVPVEAGSTTVNVQKLEADPVATTGAGNSGSLTARPDAAPGSTRRIAAIAVGGLGIVGIGAGGFFGLSAQASLSDSKDLCNDHDFCTARGAELRSSAQSKALAATVIAGAGVATLATAAVLWFTAPKSETLGAFKQPLRERAWAFAPASSGWGLELHHEF